MEANSDQRFLMPFLPPRHLSRPRLLDRLDEAASAAITVLSAGAGAGKTLLLTEWARRQAALTRAMLPGAGWPVPGAGPAAAAAS